MRGCGVADSLPLGDEISRTAVGVALRSRRNHRTTHSWTAMSDVWRPYRMWATVLLHMAWRRDQPAAPSYRQGR